MRNYRLPALQHSLFSVRSTLRSKFRRLTFHDLPERSTFGNKLQPPLDTDVLRLMQRVTITGRPTMEEASTHYEQVRERSPNGMPAFEEAVERGWFREIDGAATESSALHEYLRCQSAPFAEEFREYFYWLREGKIIWRDDVDCGTAAQLKAHLEAPRAHQCPPLVSPAWICGRLWDTAVRLDLRNWTRKWETLSHPTVIPAQVWTEKIAASFRSAVLQSVRTSNLPRWDEGDPMTAVRFQGDVRVRKSVSIEPHLLTKHLLLHTPAIHGAWAYDPADLTTLLGQLILELPYIADRPVPSENARAIVDLSLQHPDVLTALTGFAHRSPEALADFVLCPGATALVCYLVATWHRDVVVDRNSRDPAQVSIQHELLKDCLAVFEHFLVQEHVAAEEYCRLLIALHDLELDNVEASGLTALIVEHISSMPVEIGIAIREGFALRCSDAISGRDFAVMLKVFAAVDGHISRNAKLVCNAYQKFFDGQSYLKDLMSIDGPGAASLIQVALSQPTAIRDAVLKPIDIRSSFERGDSSSKISEALRSHIRVLSRAVAGFPEEVPDVLIATLVKTIKSGASDRRSKNQVDAFEFEINIGRRREPPISDDLIAALNGTSNPGQQEDLLTAILKIEEPIVLARLSMRLPNTLRTRLRERLLQLGPGDASGAHFTAHLEDRISTLLDAGLPDIAALYIAELEQRSQGDLRPEKVLERLRMQLHLNYSHGDLTALRATTVPPGLNGDYREEARRTIHFFEALAFLQDAVPNPGAAAELFLRLYNQTKSPAFAINLLAARVTKLLSTNLFATMNADAATQAKRALRHLDAALPNRQLLTHEARAVLIPNVAALLLALNQPTQALMRLQELVPVERSTDSVAYEAVANFRLGDLARANAIIRAAKAEYGEHVPILVGAEKHIAHSTPHSAPPKLLLQSDSHIQIRAALKMFNSMSPVLQATVLTDGALPLEQVMCALMQDSLAAFAQLLSALKLDRHSFHEDDFNAILAGIAQSRVEALFGWHAHEQSSGGYTQNGNSGRRDWVLKKNGVDIAVFEGLKATRPTDKAITTHFHKLFAYSTASIFFHVIYAMEGRIPELERAIIAVAKNPPSGTSYSTHRAIPSDGGRLGGLRGAYRRDRSDVTVFFFVVDMRQSAMRQAVGAPQIMS